jgi:uncharacterized membrane protein YsdA (DUF1294 family)
MLLKKVPVYMYTDNSQNVSFLANVRIIKGKHVQLKGKITTRNAQKVLYAGAKIKKTRKLSRGKLSIVLAVALLVALNVGSYMGYVPMPLKYAYYGLSITTFIAYAYDKFKAKRDAWRTPESTLHLLALLGGWPGAAIAQQVCRHKSSKRDFRVMFWITVFINLAMLAWLMSPYGKKLLMLIPNSIGFF